MGRGQSNFDHVSGRPLPKGQETENGHLLLGLGPFNLLRKGSGLYDLSIGQDFTIKVGGIFELASSKLDGSV